MLLLGLGELVAWLLALRWACRGVALVLCLRLRLGLVAAIARWSRVRVRAVGFAVKVEEACARTTPAFFHD